MGCRINVKGDKMKKKVLLILSLTITMLYVNFALSLPFSYANERPSIKIEDVTGVAGETVEVKVIISNNPGIIAMSFDVEYDTSKLKLIKVEDKKLLGTSTSVFGKDISANPYRLCWDDLSYSNNEQNGVLATLTFKILENATGEAEIDLILNQGSTFNIDMENVDFSVYKGKIVVSEPEASTISSMSANTALVSQIITELLYMPEDEREDGIDDASNVLKILKLYALIQTGEVPKFIEKQFLTDNDNTYNDVLY